MASADAAAPPAAAGAHAKELHKKPSMLSKFKRAGNMIAISNRCVKLRPAEAEYYNSVYSFFDLDFEKPPKPEKSGGPSSLNFKFSKLDAPDNVVGSKKGQAPAPSSSSDDSDSEAEEDFGLGGFTFGNPVGMKRNTNINFAEPATPERSPEKAHSPSAAESMPPAAGPNMKETDNADKQKGETQEKIADADALAAMVGQDSAYIADKFRFPEGYPPPGAWTQDDPAQMLATKGPSENAKETRSLADGGKMVLTLEATGDLRKGGRVCWQCMCKVKTKSNSCDNCGADLKKSCWSCGKPVDPTWLRCKRCGVEVQKPKKKKLFVLNPNQYLAKRMSILSFAEFKNEVRQMKLEWQKEAAKWNWFNENLDTAMVLSSAQFAQKPRMDTDRGAGPSRFSGLAYQSPEGLWDPQDIFLAPDDGSGRPGADYRSARFDMAAKYRKVRKTVDSLSGIGDKAEAEESAETKEQDEAQEHFAHGEEQSFMIKRLRELQEGLAAAYDEPPKMPMSIFEAVAASVLNGDVEETPPNNIGYRLDTGPAGLSRKDRRDSFFVLNGSAVSSRSLWQTAPSTPRTPATRRIRSTLPSGARPLSNTISRAKQFIAGHSGSVSIQRPQVADTMLWSKRPMTEACQRNVKELASEGTRGRRGSWVSNRSVTNQDTEGRIHSPRTLPIAPRTPHMNRASPAAPSVDETISRGVMRWSSVDSDIPGYPAPDSLSMSPAHNPLIQVRPPTIVVRMQPKIQSHVVENSDIAGNDNVAVHAAPPQSSRPSTCIAHVTPTVLQLRLDVLRTPSILSSHENTYPPQRPAAAVNWSQALPRPPNTARDARSTQIPFHMWGRVGDGELMSMGVKSHHSPILSGLATPRRSPRPPHCARHQSRPSSVYDSTISSARKSTVAASVVLPQDSELAQYSPLSEGLDLFEHFADGMRMKKVGLLACLEFLGYLQPQPHGRRRILTSARRITPIEALEVFESVLDCTSASDDEDEEEATEDANKLGGRGLTEAQFEAVLHVLDLRIRRAESSFCPLSAAVTGSDSVGNMLRTSPRGTFPPRHRHVSPPAPAAMVPYHDSNALGRTDGSPWGERGSESTSAEFGPDPGCSPMASLGSPRFAHAPIRKGPALTPKDVPSLEHGRAEFHSRPVLM